LGRTGAPQLWRILDEGVLHRAIGGSKVMRSQLYRLAEVAEHPKTTIQVIRAGAWRRLAQHKLAELDEQIARAQAARDAIRHALRCPREDITQCPNFAAL